MDVEGEGGENNGEDNNEEDEDDVDDESDGDADEEVDEEFRAKLAEALNVQGMLAEGDGNDDEEEEELLGDEDMAEFDEKLAEIFRLKKLQKAEKKGELINRLICILQRSFWLPIDMTLSLCKHQRRQAKYNLLQEQDPRPPRNLYSQTSREPAHFRHHSSTAGPTSQHLFHFRHQADG